MKARLAMPGRLTRLFLGMAALFAADSQAASLASGAANAISASDWSAIRAEYETNRHAAVAEPGGWRAWNPGQQWTVHFHRAGFTLSPQAGGWTWGLQLRRYGFAGHERNLDPVPPTASGNTVRYERAGLTEWFVNDRSGLEQGFTLTEPPKGTAGFVHFELATTGSLSPENRGSHILFVNAAGDPILQYGGLKAWDDTGKVLPSKAELVGEGLRLTIDGRGARYPIVVDPVAQQARLIPIRQKYYEEFGSSIAIYGDTVVVGAPKESGASTGVNSDSSNGFTYSSGAAYVFRRVGAETWVQQAYLKASNTGPGDEFGAAVAVSLDTILVSAPGEDSGATGVNGDQADNSVPDSGAVYVFRQAGATWVQEAYLKATNTKLDRHPGDHFGRSVAISGDTAVVGASDEDSNATGVNRAQSNDLAPYSGAAYVFTRAAGSWTHQAYLKASNTESYDLFGTSVAISGDTIIVGATGESSNGEGVDGNSDNNLAYCSGAAYVFTRKNGAWSQQAYLKASSPDPLDNFGSSVSLFGDAAVVGAPGESSNATGIGGDERNNGASASGAAYVFRRTGEQWVQQAYIKASNPHADSRFGVTVSLFSDALVIGAPGEKSATAEIGSNIVDPTCGSPGAVYLFGWDGRQWGQNAYLRVSDACSSSALQCPMSVSITADTFVASLRDFGYGYGGAYVFTMPTNPPPTITPAQPLGRQAETVSVLVARVEDRQDAAGSIGVEIVGENPSNGVTVSDVVNRDGNVTANVSAAACTSSNATFILRATDTGGATAEAPLSVAIAPMGDCGRRAVPESVSMSPSVSMRGRETFRFVSRDTDGDVAYLQIRFTSYPVDYYECYIHYDPANNVFYLFDRTTSQWFGLVGGSRETISNDSCLIDGASSGSLRTGTDVTAIVDISLRARWSGDWNAYLFTADEAGHESGWRAVGSWRSDPDPTLQEVREWDWKPGLDGVDRLKLSVGGGRAVNPELSWLAVNIAGSHNATDGCYIHYDATLNVFYLRRDNATGWLGLHAQSTGSVENSKCRLSGTQAGWLTAEARMRIEYALEFKPDFTGPKNLYVKSGDAKNRILNWREVTRLAAPQ